ncbi:hypothetical protein [Phenylobacterium sp.]|uniref:hypothetical protein n=1 Tax=Phenylobacterium sp. TaxID=1871053 RepID=UPI003D26657E
MSTDDPQALAIRRNSRRAALLSLVGGAVILAAFAGSALQLQNLAKAEAEQAARVGALRKEEAQLLASIAAQKRALLEEKAVTKQAYEEIAKGDTRGAQQTLAEAQRVSTPRVYFQVRSAGQAEVYRRCASVLRAGGARVPPYEVVQRGPAQNEVRYFHQDEATEAEQLAQTVRACLGGPVRLSYVGAYANVNALHFEVWLAP